MDDRLKQLGEYIRSHGPFREKDLMAINAKAAHDIEGNKSRAAKRVGLTRKTLKIRLGWFGSLLSKD